MTMKRTTPLYASRNSPRRLVLEGTVPMLLMLAVAQLVVAQEIVNPISDDDAIPFYRILESIIPTTFENATNSPSLSPSAPTSHPSAMPTDSLSNSPTLTFVPSGSPTVSSKPSPAPTLSHKPTGSPTISEHPTFNPTISFRPTLSPRPTITYSPTISPLPSVSPTMSAMPTISRIPSSRPSDKPSNTPTASMQPSMRPSVSHGPTLSMYPSSLPSRPPSAVPSATHSASPTTFEPTVSPSRMPTLSTESIVQPKITMTIDGMPGMLNDIQEGEWERFTSDHVFDYFKDLNEVFPDLVPVNLTEVITIFKTQSIAPRSKSGDGEVLVIEYSQNVTYGIWKDFDEDLNEFIFVAPFDHDKEEYLFTLYNEWDLPYWLGMDDVVVGETDAPTVAPISPPEETGTSKGAIAGSVSSVLVACLIVGALLWDRQKKEALYQESQVQHDETLEFDNAGQPVDWRNPYNAANGILQPQDPATVGPASEQRQSESDGTANSTATPLRTASRHDRGISLSGSNERLATASGAASGNNVMIRPPASPSQNRHTSLADTEITDITYSDGGGGRFSDIGSDEGPPALPRMEAEHYHDEGAPLSPLHIPDDESVDGRGMQAPHSSSPGTVLGLEESENSMSMSGFQMKVEELE